MAQLIHFFWSVSQAELESLEKVGKPQFGLGGGFACHESIGPRRIHRCERWISSTYICTKHVSYIL